MYITKLMKILSLLLIFISCSIFANAEQYRAKWGPRIAPIYTYPPQTYNISLDVNYTEKWTQVINDKKENLTKLMDFYFKQLDIPNFVYDIPYSWFAMYNVDFALECQAIADLLGVSIAKVFIYNFMYETYAYCTSIVVQDTEGNIIHGRNLDYDMVRLMAGVAYNGNFYRNRSLVYRGNGFAGFLGLNTGEKPGMFSISANQRDKLNNSVLFDEILGLEDNLYHLIFERQASMVYLIRQVFEEANSYDEAISMLSNTKIIAPVYYIVSGVSNNQGVVITMNRDSVFNITTLDVENGIWFLVQTNYDRNLPDPIDDNRRSAAEARLAAIGQSRINSTLLMDDILSIYPNFNRITIFSSVYSAQDDSFWVKMWY